MPVYEYRCLDIQNCGGYDEITRGMTAPDEDRVCECGTDMVRVFSFHCSKDSYTKPLISDSLAVPIHQIAEHKQMFPNIELTKQGQPVFHNYTEHNDYLEKTGFIKQPQTPKRRIGSHKTMGRRKINSTTKQPTPV